MAEEGQEWLKGRRQVPLGFGWLAPGDSPYDELPMRVNRIAYREFSRNPDLPFDQYKEILGREVFGEASNPQAVEDLLTLQGIFATERTWCQPSPLVCPDRVRAMKDRGELTAEKREDVSQAAGSGPGDRAATPGTARRKASGSSTGLPGGLWIDGKAKDNCLRNRGVEALLTAGAITCGVRLMPLTDHPGGYRFLPGIAPYSCGVVSAPGFEIVHVTFQRPVPYKDGFEQIERHLASDGRPRTALCGVELRSPRPFTFEGFARVQRGVCPHPGRVGPVRRWREPGRPHQRRPGGRSAHRAGSVWVLVYETVRSIPATDLRRRRGGRTARGRSGGRGDRPRRGHLTGRHRRQGGGSSWTSWSTACTDWAATGTPSPPSTSTRSTRSGDMLPGVILARRPRPAVHGIRWFYSRPPIVGIEYEMDLRGVRTELRIG